MKYERMGMVIKIQIKMKDIVLVWNMCLGKHVVNIFDICE
jgi:hypothetical protein